VIEIFWSISPDYQIMHLQTQNTIRAVTNKIASCFTLSCAEDQHRGRLLQKKETSGVVYYYGECILDKNPEIWQRRESVQRYSRTDQFAGRRVVTIGGGSGTFSFLSHLKKYPMKITAVVTMSDSGGSSRRLMDEFRRQLPLGDLRMSLVALAENGA